MSGRGGTSEETGNVGVIERVRVKPKEKIKRPSFYAVVVHNDPFTPRGFVVQVLKKLFDKDESEANRIMLLAHNFGVGAIAKFTREIAEQKVKQANEYSRESGYPLFFSAEEE